MRRQKRYESVIYSRFSSDNGLLWFIFIKITLTFVCRLSGWGSQEKNQGEDLGVSGSNLGEKCLWPGLRWWKSRIQDRFLWKKWLIINSNCFKRGRKLSHLYLNFIFLIAYLILKFHVLNRETVFIYHYLKIETNAQFDYRNSDTLCTVVLIFTCSQVFISWAWILCCITI